MFTPDQEAWHRHKITKAFAWAEALIWAQGRGASLTDELIWNAIDRLMAEPMPDDWPWPWLDDPPPMIQ